MKKIKLLSLMVGMVIAMVFSSCNSDTSSSYKVLTPQEKSYCYSLVAGSRMNKLVYPSDEHVTEVTTTTGKQKEYLDTVNVATRIYGSGKDTLLSVRNIPLKIFARYIPEGSENNALKEALKKYEGTANLDLQVGFYATDPITFLLYPTSTLSCTLEYGGASHKIDFYVTAPSYFTYGQYDSQTKKVESYILMYGYKIDATDKDTSEPKQFSYKFENSNIYTSTQIGLFE